MDAVTVVSSSFPFSPIQGMTVFVNKEKGSVQYIGTTDFSNGVWLGVELKKPSRYLVLCDGMCLRSLHKCVACCNVLEVVHFAMRTNGSFIDTNFYPMTNTIVMSKRKITHNIIVRIVIYTV